MVSLVQIPNLPAVVALSGTEQFETVQAGVSRRVTLNQIASYVSNTPFADLIFETPLVRVDNVVSLTTVPITLGGTGATTAQGAAQNLSLVMQGPSLAWLKARDIPTGTQTALTQYRTSPGDQAGGSWAWRTGNQSLNIIADPQQGVWVAPDADPTGASGAWQRLYSGALSLLWFGGAGNNSTDNEPAWTGMDSYIRSTATGDQQAALVFVPAGNYKQSPTSLSASYVIAGAGDLATEFFPMASAQTHIFEFTGRVVQMHDFGIVGWPTRDAVNFVQTGIITDGGEYDFYNYRVYNCVQGFWAKRGRRFANASGSIGVLGEGGVGIRLGGIDFAANPLTAQSCVDNPIVGQSWSAGIIQFTTTNPHGMASYDTFIVYGASNPNYNGTFRAIGGTTGTTLRARLATDPGVAGTPGTITVATYVAQQVTRVRRTGLFNIYGSSPAGYNGKWSAITGTAGATLVACISSNPGASTVLGISSSARGWGAATSETRLGPNLAIYSGSSSTSLQDLTNMSWSPTDGGLVTFTTDYEHQMEVGDRFTVRNCTPVGYNGTYTALFVDEQIVVAAKPIDPNLLPNAITAQSWSGGYATYTTTVPHGLAEGDDFTIEGSLPSGYSGSFVAAEGTTGSTIITEMPDDPGVSSTLGNLIVYGEIYGRYNGTGILCDTDNGATVVENVETGSCDYAIRVADTLGLGNTTGDNYRGTGFLKLRGVTTGNCGTAGVSIEANGRSFKAFSCSISAPGDADADGIYIDSTLASPQITGCEWHYCRRTAINLMNAYSLTVKGSIISDIGTRGGGTPGIGLLCQNGNAQVYFTENTINPDLQVNTSATMDYGVLLAADTPTTAFTGTVYVAGNTVVDMNIADYAKLLPCSGTLEVFADSEFNVISANASAAEATDYVASNSVSWVTSKFTSTWDTPWAITGGKRVIILPCGEATIESTSTPAIRVSGSDNRFDGDWWVKCVGTAPGLSPLDMLCVEVMPNSYRHHWETFKPEDFGIGMQATNGPIREILNENFEPLNLLSYGKRFYSVGSGTNGDEIGLLRDNRIYTSINKWQADNCIMYSIGPNVGSGGLLGYEHHGGLQYGGKRAIHAWANVPIISQSWLANVVTFTTEEPHGVQVGGLFKIRGSNPSGYDSPGDGYVAIAGTTERTLKAELLVDPGASVTPGTFGPSILQGQQFSECPRSLRWQNYTRRGGTSTSYLFDSGADFSMIDCKSDDPGTFAPAQGPLLAISNQSWLNGVVSYVTPSDSSIRDGDYFYVAGSSPAGYNGTFRAIAGTGPTVVRATMVSDPGLSSVTGTIQESTGILAQSWSAGVVTFVPNADYGINIGDYFEVYGSSPSGYNGTFQAIAGTTPTSIRANLAVDPGASVTLGYIYGGSFGVYLGPYFQGVFKWQGGQFHEHTNNAICNMASIAESVTISDTLIYNSSNARDGVWSGYYQDPACSNVTLINVTSGTQDSWRHPSGTLTISGTPTDGQTTTFNGTAVTWRTTPTLPNEVAIGASVTARMQNLVNFINTANYSPFTDISPRVDYVTNPAAPVMTIIRYPGSQAYSPYTMANTATGVSVSGNLAGGTGSPKQKYGFENITHGVRNCSVINCNGRNNLSGAFSTQVPRTLPSGGGTGVINNDRSTLTISGAYGTTLTLTGTTAVTLPTSGTLATLAGTENFTNKTYSGNTWTPGTGTLTIGAGKTLTANNSVTLAGTDGTTMTFPALSGTVATLNTSNSFTASQFISGTNVGLAIGNTALIPFATNTPKLQSVGTTDGIAALGVALWNSTTTVYARAKLAHSRGGTIGTHSAVTSSTVLGSYEFEGSDGTNFVIAAQLRGRADGTISSGVVPGAAEVWTADSVGTSALRATFDSKGNVVLNNAALATTATDGFLYIAGGPGAPTGVPTSYTGRVPLYVDTTNNKLYFYSGGSWRDAGP